MKNEDIAQMVTALTAAACAYDYIGLRVTPERLSPGPVGPSRKWEDGSPTAEYLPGTCAVRVDRRALAQLGRGADPARMPSICEYPGRYISVVVALDSESGEDDREIILRDATVLASYPLY